jgi:hypothetical protein
MEMGEKNVPDEEIIFGGEIEIKIDVALGIDHGRDARGFISDEIGSVRQAIQIELLENHAASLREWRGGDGIRWVTLTQPGLKTTTKQDYSGWGTIRK